MKESSPQRLTKNLNICSFFPSCLNNSLHNSLLKEFPVAFLELLIGEKLLKDALKPLDTKLQKVIEREADLIVENTETGDIYHVEFQSTNDLLRRDSFFLEFLY